MQPSDKNVILPKLTIGIINRNTINLLSDLLSSILTQKITIQYEIIVVDNASKDGSAEMVKNLFPQVKLIRNQTNKGFTIPCNQIIKEMRGEYLFLLNTDLILFPDVIEKLLEFLETNPKIAVCGPKLYNRDMTIQLSAQKFHTLSSIFWEIIGLSKRLPKNRIFGHAFHFSSEINKIIEVDYISGAFMAINRKAIDDVGYFDEDYFLYVQEVDFCLRCKKRGWEIYYYPYAEAIHFQGETAKVLSFKANYWMWRDRLVYFQKHYNHIYASLYRYMVRAVMLLKFLTLAFPLFWNKEYIYKKQKEYVHILKKF